MFWKFSFEFFPRRRRWCGAVQWMGKQKTIKHENYTLLSSFLKHTTLLGLKFPKNFLRSTVFPRARVNRGKVFPLTVFQFFCTCLFSRFRLPLVVMFWSFEFDMTWREYLLISSNLVLTRRRWCCCLFKVICCGRAEPGARKLLENFN